MSLRMVDICDGCGHQGKVSPPITRSELDLVIETVKEYAGALSFCRKPECQMKARSVLELPGAQLNPGAFDPRGGGQ